MAKTAEDKIVDELREMNLYLKRLDKDMLVGFSRLENGLEKIFAPRREASDEIRPCYVSKKAFKNGPKKALFHRLIELKTPNMTQTLGLVEYEDGSMEQVKPTSIIFTDSAKYFYEYRWSDGEENNEEATEEDISEESEALEG